jgi:hypothetical protein
MECNGDCRYKCICERKSKCGYKCGCNKPTFYGYTEITRKEFWNSILNASKNNKSNTAIKEKLKEIKEE